MTKVRPFIIINSRLKKRILEELVEELNIDNKFKKENLNLLMEYARLKLELLNYLYIIPYKELNKYKRLKHQKKKTFSKLKKLLYTQ